MTYPTTPGHVATDTSIAAAGEIAGDAASLRERVWRYIDSPGHWGRTCDEVEYALAMRHQTASARIRELVLAGRLIDSGERRLTRSGRRAAVYVVAKKEETPCQNTVAPTVTSECHPKGSQMELF